MLMDPERIKVKVSLVNNAIGYLVAQYPAGYLLQRLPIAKFLGCTTILWGVIVITTPACRNFSGIAANRFLLGFVESAVNPGFILIMSM